MLFLIPLCIGILYRAYLIFYKFEVFTSDTAVLCLMAKHIMHATELPLLLHGQSYLGVFPAYCIALFFSVFGVTLTAFHIYMLVISILFYITLVLITSSLFSRQTVWWVVLFMMIPPYSFITLPGYCVYHVFLIYCAVFFWMTCRWFLSPAPVTFYLIGLAAGFGFYLHPMFLYNILFFLVAYIIKQYDLKAKRSLIYHAERMIFWSLCFLAGSIFYLIGLEQNWIYYNPFSQVLSSTPQISGISNTFTQALPQFFGIYTNSFFFRYFVAVFFAFSCLYAFYVLVSLRHTKPARWLAGLLTVCILLVFIFESLRNVPAARHLIPLCVSIPILISFILGDVYKRFSVLACGILVVLFAYNVHTVISAPSHHKDYSGLQTYLKENDFHYGFADFWLTYKLVFLSDESIILSPLYGVDRYPRYTHQVFDDNKPFYIFDYADPYQQGLCDYFEATLHNGPFVYEKHQYDDFIIYHEIRYEWHDQLLPVRLVRPIFEENFNIVPGSTETIDKTIDFPLSLPSESFRMINAVESPYIESFADDKKTVNFWVTTVPDEAMLCNESVLNKSFADHPAEHFSITTFFPQRKLFDFHMYFVDKRGKWRYMCIL